MPLDIVFLSQFFHIFQCFFVTKLPTAVLYIHVKDIIK